MPCGIQILAGANREALAAALAGGLDFIRAEGFVFGHVADEGWIDASAGELMRYRRQIGAEAIAVWCDVKKKHSAHAATADVDIAETAHAAEFFLADAVIITGAATGRAADLGEVRRVKATVRVPVVIGSGVTADNVRACLDVADAVIVGSSLKQGGRWSGAVERQRVERLLAAR
jgi:membrane complex biogenesis BtpA family protein